MSERNRPRTHGWAAESTIDTMKKARKRLPATVRKIVEPAHPAEPEKAEIAIQNADELYREIRVENRLTTDSGTLVRLKPGEEVEVQIEADEKSVEKK